MGAKLYHQSKGNIERVLEINLDGLVGKVFAHLLVSIFSLYDVIMTSYYRRKVVYFCPKSYFLISPRAQLGIFGQTLQLIVHNVFTQFLVPKFLLYDVIMTSYTFRDRCIFGKKSTFFSFFVICDVIYRANEHFMHQIIIFVRYMTF